jgi:hypothetical protein
MPLVAVNYLNTIIYKIVCKDLSITDVYIGQTTNFRTRKSQHKRNCCNLDYKKHNLKVYQYIRENGGWENFDMIEIEKYDANEAKKRERYWFEELNAKLNQIYPSRTKQEYQDSTKEKMKIYYQEYNNNNKEKRAIQKKVYSEKNAEKLKGQKIKYSVNEENKKRKQETDKSYREKNVDKLKDKRKEYYNSHKEKCLAKNKMYKENNLEK